MELLDMKEIPNIMKKGLFFPPYFQIQLLMTQVMLLQKLVCQGQVGNLVLIYLV